MLSPRGTGLAVAHPSDPPKIGPQCKPILRARTLPSAHRSIPAARWMSSAHRATEIRCGPVGFGAALEAGELQMMNASVELSICKENRKEKEKNITKHDFVSWQR